MLKVDICVCGAISFVNIDLSIRCALFYSVHVCSDGCFCSCLYGVLEGSPRLYIQTQTFSNSPCGVSTHSAALFTSVRKKEAIERAEIKNMTEYSFNQSGKHHSVDQVSFLCSKSIQYIFMIISQKKHSRYVYR